MPWMRPVPVKVRPRSRRARSCRPSRVKISRSASPGWVVRAGQSGIVTRPPVTSAAARNGAALERSGSTVRSRPSSGPGRPATRGSPPVSGSSTWAPTVAQHGDGHPDVRHARAAGAPVWRTSTPLVEAGRRQQQRADELARTRRRRSPPGRRRSAPRAVHRQRQRAAAVVVDPRRRARAARRSRRPAGARGSGGRRRSGCARRRGPRPAAGSA